MELRGADALVTGASRGIGAALLRALRAAGANAVGIARRDAAGVQSCDVTDEAAVRALRERTGPVDLLVNNAAVIHEPAPVVEVPLDEWRRVLDVNVLGTVAMIRAYLPAMCARGRGIVVNVSSGWGRHAEALQAPYCASKFAVEALTAAVAGEVPRGVAVFAVNPGVVATDMLATAFSGRTAGATPPDACAAAFVAMLREAGPSWNGRSVDVDRWSTMPA